MLPPTLQLLSPLADEELVERIVAGDTAAFELLMRRHNQRLFRLARSVIRDNDDAEEIVQETYLRAYANLARFEGRSSVITWLSRIAFHEALRRKRQKQRAKTTQGLNLDSLPMSDSTSDGISLFMQADLRAALTKAIDSLPDGMRAIVMLRLVEGLSTKETAHSLRLSESYVKVGLHRARRLLRATMERQSVSELREAFTFGEERCDRVVRNVFHRLGTARAETDD
jgi:RNA polymerase sigma-70 factor (ECF subfamily)